MAGHQIEAPDVSCNPWRQRDRYSARERERERESRGHRPNLKSGMALLMETFARGAIPRQLLRQRAAPGKRRHRWRGEPLWRQRALTSQRVSQEWPPSLVICSPDAESFLLGTSPLETLFSWLPCKFARMWTPEKATGILRRRLQNSPRPSAQTAKLPSVRMRRHWGNEKRVGLELEKEGARHREFSKARPNPSKPERLHQGQVFA